MRLLIATPDFPPARGGIQILVERLARQLAHHDVLVAAAGAAAPPIDTPTGAYDVVATMPAGGRRAAIAALNVTLPALARRWRPDAIISAHIVCGPGALAAGRTLGVPVIQYAHAMELAVRGRSCAAVLRRADLTIAVSAFTRDLAIASGAPADRVVVIHPGVDPPGSVESPGTEPIVLTIGRLENRYKGFDVMLRAMPLVLARVPNARWVVLGDGHLRTELEATAAANDSGPSVTFLGAVSDDERDGWLARARVFAMPSRVTATGAGEGFGIVFLEAGRFAVPSVTANEGGAADAVLHGVTGTHVDPRDHVALAAAICELLVDDELHARYAAGARRRAAELSWEAMARGVESAVERLLSGRTG